jgi:hypothetical protein
MDGVSRPNTILSWALPDSGFCGHQQKWVWIFNDIGLGIFFEFVTAVQMVRRAGVDDPTGPSQGLTLDRRGAALKSRALPYAVGEHASRVRGTAAYTGYLVVQNLRRRFGTRLGETGADVFTIMRWWALLNYSQRAVRSPGKRRHRAHGC